MQGKQFKQSRNIRRPCEQHQKHTSVQQQLYSSVNVAKLMLFLSFRIIILKQSLLSVKKFNVPRLVHPDSFMLMTSG